MFSFIWEVSKPHKQDLATDYPRSCPGRLEIFFVNAFQGAGPPRKPSKKLTYACPLESVLLEGPENSQCKREVKTSSLTRAIFSHTKRAALPSYKHPVALKLTPTSAWTLTLTLHSPAHTSQNSFLNLFVIGVTSPLGHQNVTGSILVRNSEAVLLIKEFDEYSC